MKDLGFYHQNDIEDKKLEIADYLYHPSTFYLNNLQTRLISGVSFEKGDEVTEQIIEIGLDNLRKFIVAGVTERFAESLALMKIKLKWNHIPMLVFSNSNELNKPVVSDDIKREIEKREKYDMILYKIIF